MRIDTNTILIVILVFLLVAVLVVVAVQPSVSGSNNGSASGTTSSVATGTIAYLTIADNSVRDTQVQLTWANCTNGYTNYQLIYSTTSPPSSSNGTVIVVNNATTTTIATLTPVTTYYFLVQALDSDSNIVEGSQVVSTQQTTDSLSGLMVQFQYSTQLNVSWNTYTNALQYTAMLYRSKQYRLHAAARNNDGYHIGCDHRITSEHQILRVCICVHGIRNSFSRSCNKYQHYCSTDEHLIFL